MTTTNFFVHVVVDKTRSLTRKDCVTDGAAVRHVTGVPTHVHLVRLQSAEHNATHLARERPRQTPVVTYISHIKTPLVHVPLV